MARKIKMIGKNALYTERRAVDMKDDDREVIMEGDNAQYQEFVEGTAAQNFSAEELKEAGRKLEEALTDEKDRARQIDFLSFEIREIDEAGLREGEDEELEARYRRLSNARKILETAAQAEELTGSDNGPGQASSPVRTSIHRQQRESSEAFL